MNKPPRTKKPTRSGELPTSKEILDFIATSPGVVGKRDIAKAFGLHGQAKIGLKSLLKDLEGQRQVDRKGKQLARAGGVKPVSVIEITRLDDDGHAIAQPVEWDEEADGPAPDILLLIEHRRGVVAPGVGERVLARVEATVPRHGCPAYAARVMRALGREAIRVVGVFRSDVGGGGRIIPSGKKDRYDYRVSRGDDGGAVDGELVSAEITRAALRGLPQARIKTRLGNGADPRNISLIAIHAHGIPDVFPDAVLDEVKSLQSFTLQGREDLRAIPLVTIDPRDARDHDDAVWAEADTSANNVGGHKLIVAIADVAAYVRPQTALDKEARKRGNSTYFPDRVVPMLPERISNDLCSLREDEDRPALACFITIGSDGRKIEHRFGRIIMRSAAKIAYEDAQAAIDGRGTGRAKDLLHSVLKPLWAAYRTMDKARLHRGPLELDLPERKIILDDKGNIARVEVPERLDAHRLIEEYMIQANVAAAETLAKSRTPLLYRVHEEPSQEKLKTLSDFLRSVNIPFTMGQVVRSKHFNQILAAAKGTTHERLGHEVVLRSQSQANYRPDNGGHFGLSLSNYAHFTSPIRRYADLIVHRALVSAQKFGDDGLAEWDVAHLKESADLISAAERRSMIAERETLDRLVASHLNSQLGATFGARISGVVGAGLFLSLMETGADGFVPVSSLGGGYFVLDDVRHALVASGTGETFQLGDVVQVKLMEVAPVKGGLRFEMLSDGKAGAAPAKYGRERKPKAVKFKGRKKR